MTLVGAGKLNLHPCTDAEEARNLQILSSFITYVNNVIIDGTADTYKVKHDTGDANPDFHLAKHYPHGVYDDSIHQLVFSDTHTDSGVDKVRLFTAMTGDGGGGGVDTYKVLISLSDSTPEYLWTSMQDQDTYDDGTTDILVYAEAVGSGNEKLRLFTRVDATFIDVLTTNLFEGDNAITLSGLYWDDGTLGLGYIAIRGQATANITANTASFTIDNVVALGSGKSPGSSVTIYQAVQKEAFRDNTWITAIYNSGTSHWEILQVERFRAGRGLAKGAVATSDSTFTVDNIKMLESSADPRTDPTDTAEALTIQNIDSSAWADNANVWFDFNESTGQWDARPKPASGNAALKEARVVLAIPAATSTYAAGWAEVAAACSLTDDDTGAEIDPDNPVDVVNRKKVSYAIDCQVTLDMSFSPARVVTGDCDPDSDFWTDPE